MSAKLLKQRGKGAVHVLELIGTAESRAVFQEFARSTAGALSAHEAQASLGRLTQRVAEGS